ENAIREKGLKTVEEVGEVTNAGTGCGGCQEQIQEILDEINGK
ncbi:MAG: (2Fe-2S)-binding protein, partial [Odoribacter sp.]|nr:(2Fe-2S)-binding protein [Odoribacter sp.]